MSGKSDHSGRVRIIGVLGLLAAAGTADAQVPGTPALQNAFANPGLAVAANLGSGSGQSFFGAAAAYGFGGGRLQLSGAAGVHRANDASRGGYGVRAAASVWTSSGGALGAGAFVGVGGAPRTRDESNVTTNPALLTIPAGITISWRRAIGETRGVSVYLSPLYRWTRAEANDVSVSEGNIGGSVGVDFAVTQSIGVTVGTEFGRSDGSGGSTAFGAAVSFVPGR